MKVSVIVPIFNAEKYLDKCIESILSQTYKDIEVLLVDDGSTDGSAEICSKYQSRDSRIVFIKKENGGAVSARKVAANCATGSFIASVDADDWIESEYIENLLSLTSGNVDVVAAGHYHVIGINNYCITNSFKQGMYSVKDMIGGVLYYGEFFKYGIQPHICNKLIRTDLFKKYQARVEDSLRIGDDAAVVYPCIINCSRIFVTDYCGYHYLQNPNSMSKNKLSDERNRISKLVLFLADAFSKSDYSDTLLVQLKMYEKYMYTMRDISYFDKTSLIEAFGGVSAGGRIVLYGAGVFGKQIWRYINNTKEITLAKWVDINYEEYQKNGLAVENPNILEYFTDYDFVIIANLLYETANHIRLYLIQMGIPNSKIKWFSNEFLTT